MSIGHEDFGVIVYRNGEVTNRFDDGTTDVPGHVDQYAAQEKILYHPKADEETYEWQGVIVDNQGRFLKFNI